MITAIDFSEYELNGKYYGGSERKEGITIDGADYMIKYQKQSAFGRRNNHISEFIGSHIFELCGFQVHKTYLGYRDGEHTRSSTRRPVIPQMACFSQNQRGTSTRPRLQW